MQKGPHPFGQGTHPATSSTGILGSTRMENQQLLPSHQGLLISVWPRSLTIHASWSLKTLLGFWAGLNLQKEMSSFPSFRLRMWAIPAAGFWWCKDGSREWQTNSFSFQLFRTPMPKDTASNSLFSFLLHSCLTASDTTNTLLSAHVNPPCTVRRSRNELPTRTEILLYFNTLKSGLPMCNGFKTARLEELFLLMPLGKHQKVLPRALPVDFYYNSYNLQRQNIYLCTSVRYLLNGQIYNKNPCFLWKAAKSKGIH